MGADTHALLKKNMTSVNGGKKQTGSVLLFLHYLDIPRFRDLKTNPHTQLTSKSVNSHSICFRTLTDNLNFWVTGITNTLVFSGSAL